MAGQLQEFAELREVAELQKVGDSVAENYKLGVCLIRTIYKHYKFPGPGQMEKTDSAEIPATTQFVNIAITGVKMVFGSEDHPRTGTLGGFLFEVVVKTPRDKLNLGKVDYYIQTHMTHESSGDPWFGTLAITIMCFGTPA